MKNCIQGAAWIWGRRDVIDVCAIWVAGRNDIELSWPSSPPCCCCLKGFLWGKRCPENNMAEAPWCAGFVNWPFVSAHLAWWDLVVGSYSKFHEIDCIAKMDSDIYIASSTFISSASFLHQFHIKKNIYVYICCTTITLLGEGAGCTSDLLMSWIVTEKL